MSWDEELKGIRIGTLFAFFGKVLVGMGLWYLMALIPLIVIALLLAQC